MSDMPVVRLSLKDCATKSVIEAECPSCGYPRRVEPDANYEVRCDGCGMRFKVVSPI